jgi:hypothetical protein
VVSDACISVAVHLDWYYQFVVIVMVLDDEVYKEGFTVSYAGGGDGMPTAG